MSAEYQEKVLETELRETIAMLQAKAEEFGNWQEADGLTRETFDKLNARIDTLQDNIVEVSKQALRTANGGSDEPKTKQADPQHEAVLKYLRKGEQRLTDVERGHLEALQKALSVDSDPDGGYLVTPEQSNRIIKVLYETSPMRQVATVETISSDALEGLFDGDEAAAGWVSERQARPETNTPQLGTWRIPVHELYANPRATQKLLDDANLNVEAWLNAKVADRFGRAENTAFVNGTGVGQPRGFTTYPAGTVRGTIERVNSRHATLIAAEGIVDIVYSLKNGYRAGSSFALNRASLGFIRTIRDDSGAAAGTGQWMWAPGFGGQPATLMGYPIVEFEDMQDVGVAQRLPVAFGNFAAAYTIVDRVGIRVLRDPYTAKPHVEFYTTKRVGGDIVNFEAIKLMVCAA